MNEASLEGKAWSKEQARNCGRGRQLATHSSMGKICDCGSLSNRNSLDRQQQQLSAPRSGSCCGLGCCWPGKAAWIDGPLSSFPSPSWCSRGDTLTPIPIQSVVNLCLPGMHFRGRRGSLAGAAEVAGTRFPRNSRKRCRRDL